MDSKIHSIVKIEWFNIIDQEGVGMIEKVIITNLEYYTNKSKLL